MRLSNVRGDVVYVVDFPQTLATIKYNIRLMSSSEELIRPVEVQAREPYRVWLRYSDGVEGEVDLSHLAGRGVFGAWADRSFFAEARIGPSGSISWGDGIDVCPDALYLRLTGMSTEEYMPRLRNIFADT